MYDPKDIPPLRCAETAGKPDFHKLIQEYRDLNSMPQGTLEKIQAVYLGMCTFMDWVLGRVMDALDETGLAEDTALFVFADHGDWAGDFGLVEKWPSALDDTMTRVPLVARIPGGAKGHRVKEQVELFDIMPTVLELADVEAKHTHFARSLVPQLKGDSGDPDRAIFAEGGYDEHEPRCFEGFPDRDSFMRNKEGIYYPKGLQQQEHPESVCRSTMIRTLEYKLIRRTKGLNELYDLKKDPQELTNVYDDPEYSRIKEELESRMLDWYIHTADSVPFKEDNRGLPPK
jgi:choline-sulfatase